MLELADRLLTPKEMHALLIWERTGCGYMKLGQLLGISRSSARDRIHRALGRLEVALKAASDD